MYNRNADNPLDADVVIVDEVSMIDAPLFWKLLEALKTGTRLILIGDYNQLPSVGMGNVLEDLINSGLINMVKLEKIHRQAQNSLIIKNAHAILNDGDLEFNDSTKDFFFIEINDPNVLNLEIINLVSNRLPSYYKINAIDDICVLTPSKREILVV